MLDSNITKSYFCTKLRKLCFISNLTKNLRLAKKMTEEEMKNWEGKLTESGVDPEQLRRMMDDYISLISGLIVRTFSLRPIEDSELLADLLK